MPELDLKKAVEEARDRKAKRIAVQVPEGLKARVPEIIEGLEKTGAEVFAFVEPCFGACDLKDAEAKALGAELLLHFGHTGFVEKPALETLYVPLEYRADAKKAALLAGKLASELKKRKMNKVALCSTIQFRGHMELLGKELAKKGVLAFIGQGKGVEKGQVLGCNYSCVKEAEAKVQAVAFVGDGLFHPLGLSFAVKKPVFIVQPVENEVKELKQQREMFLRKRIAMIEKVRQAKSVVIWVSTKPGQARMQLALQLRKKFEAKGKKAFVIASGFLSPDFLLGVEAEAIVSTACPRVAVDDSSLFRQPIIGPEEARIALGEKGIEEYAFDELF